MGASRARTETVTTMNELLTMEEMEERYANEWVVMVDIESDPGPVIRRARVAWHGTDREAAWDYVGSLPTPFHVGVFYMGPVVDDGVAIIL
jgi:hypothetical protein